MKTARSLRAETRQTNLRGLVLALSLALVTGTACTGAGTAPEEADSPPAETRPVLTDAEEAAIEAAIRELMTRQTDAWNAGDLATFVADYLDSPRMRFVSGGSVRYGTDEVLERYRQNYPDRAAMGQLSFTDLDVRVLSDEFVFVFGRYNLERESDAPTGLFTLLFERTPDGWKMSHDHTSTDD